MTYSALTSAVFALLLGVQLQLNFFSHWVTVGIIYGYTFAYTIGAATVPFILTAEVFLPEVWGIPACDKLGLRGSVLVISAQNK